MKDAVERAGFRVIGNSAIVHCPRISAIWLAGLVERFAAPRLETTFLSMLRPFEVLGRLPSRYITGHFSALVAVASG